MPRVYGKEGNKEEYYKVRYVGNKKAHIFFKCGPAFKNEFACKEKRHGKGYYVAYTSRKVFLKNKVCQPRKKRIVKAVYAA